MCVSVPCTELRCEQLLVGQVMLEQKIERQFPQRKNGKKRINTIKSTKLLEKIN